MKGTPEEVLKAIPDFTDFMALTTDISNLMYRKLSLEASIKEGESVVFKEATTNKEYFQNDKPPATSFIDNAYKYTGLNNELVPIRRELAEVISQLESKRLQLDIYKSMIEVWRTLCSNQRSTSI